MLTMFTGTLRQAGWLFTFVGCLAAAQRGNAATFANCPSTGSIRITIRDRDSYVVAKVEISCVVVLFQNVSTNVHLCSQLEDGESSKSACAWPITARVLDNGGG
jgi:hypothetical protein